MPIYEPDRERWVFTNVKKLNEGPLSNRQIQREEIGPAQTEGASGSGETELETETND